MEYQIKTHKSVEKFLDSHRDICSQFIDKFSLLKNNPRTKQVDSKALIGKPNHYRLRIGKYRFLYEIRKQEILIYVRKADSRGDIYK